jgi:hypothetical protein
MKNSIRIDWVTYITTPLTPDNQEIQNLFLELTSEVSQIVSWERILEILNHINRLHWKDGVQLFTNWISNNNEDNENIPTIRKSMALAIAHNILHNPADLSPELVFANCLAIRSGSNEFQTSMLDELKRNIAPHKVDEINKIWNKLIADKKIGLPELLLILNQVRTSIAAELFTNHPQHPYPYNEMVQQQLFG